MGTRARDRTSRLPWVDVAKAISILIVVLAHTRIELAFVGVSAVWADGVVQFFSTMRMPLFFAASGLFAAKWITGSWRGLLSRKIALLAWVFVIWQPVVFAYKVVEMELLPNQPDNSLLGQVLKVVLSPLRPNGELWFLWALCLFFVIARAMSRTPAWVQIGVPALVSFAWMTFGESMTPDSVLRLMGDGWTGLLRYYVFFAAAAVLSVRLREVLGGMRWWASAGLLLVWAAGVAAVTALGLPMAPFRFVLCVLAVLAGFGLARLLSWARPLVSLGKQTLPVYVAHVALIVAMVVVIEVTGIADLAARNGAIAVAVVWALAILGSLLLHRLLAGTRPGRYLYEQPESVSRWISRRVPERASSDDPGQPSSSGRSSSASPSGTPS